MKHGNNNAMRWIAVIPAAIGGYIFSLLSCHAAMEISIYEPSLLSFCFSPALFVICGAYVAPSRHFGTAVALTILWMLTMPALAFWSSSASPLLFTIAGLLSTLTVSFVIWWMQQGDQEAVKKWRAIAERGDAKAQSILGTTYCHGMGVTKDYVEAYKWYSLASAQGDKNAKLAMNDLEKFMTDEEIANAQQLAEEFVPRTI